MDMAFWMGADPEGEAPIFTLPDPVSLTLILIFLHPADCRMGMLPDVFSPTTWETQYKLGGRWEVLSSCLGINRDNPPPHPCHLTGVRK